MMNVLLEILQFPFRQRQRRARQERKYVSRHAFMEQLGRTEVEARAAAALWDILRDNAMVDDFRPLPDDSFSKLYALGEEDLDEDVVLEVFRRVELSPPDPTVVDTVGPIETPRDVVRLVRETAKSVEAASGDDRKEQ